MRRLVIGMMCLLPVALMGCGEGSAPEQEEAAGGADGAQAPADDGAAQEINWAEDVTMAMRQRIGMVLVMVEEMSKVFSPEDYPDLAEAQRAADALRAETSLENTKAAEEAVNAFGESIGPEDEEKLSSAMMEGMSRQFQQAMMDFMVHATETLMAELGEVFPPSEYPQFETLQQVAATTLAKPSPEAGETLEAAMVTFKGSLSEADRLRVEEIEAAVKLAEAQEATRQGNEVAVQMWLDGAEDEKDSIWVSPGARISKVAFNELAVGMSYGEVVSRLERDGESMGRSTGTFNGVSTISEVFQWAWENSDGTQGKIEGYFLDEELRAKVYFNDIQ